MRSIKKRCSSIVVAAVVAALLGVGVGVRAEDWPFARGDAHSTGVATCELPAAPALLWKYTAGEDAGFDATTVILQGIIYVGDTNGVFHAIRMSDGSNVWKRPVKDSSFNAAAAAEAGHIYVGDMNGRLYCLATADGKEVWSHELEGEVYAGPMIHGDDVLFTCEAGALSCRAKSDGTERWKFHIESPLRSTPTIAAGRAAVSGCDSLLHVIDTRDGKELATVDIDSPTGSTPAMHAGKVFFGTEGGAFFGIHFSEQADEKPAVAWTFRDPQRSQPIRAAAAVNDRIVVVGSQAKAVYGLDPETGEQKWKRPTRARVESSPVLVGDRVVVATTAGKLYLLDAATGDIRWEYDAGGSFTASPAVVDGKILIGNADGTLYCFGGKRDDE